MIEVIPTGLSDRTIGFRVAGRVDQDDMKSAAAAFESRLARHARLRVYVEIEDLKGMTPGALLEDLRMALGHFRDVEREAVVADAVWVGWLARAGNLLPGIEVRHFPRTERVQALAWIDA